MIECFLRFLKGYVKVVITGNSSERFFNLINAREIYIWNIEKIDNDTSFYIAVGDVYSLRIILRKTGMRMRIKERYGLPFFLFYHRKRKMFFAGAFTSWIIVYIMSLYIWNITYEGNFTHTDDELSKFLETMMIDEGIKKDELNPEAIEKALRNEYFDVTWASVEIKGTRLIVHIRENDSQISESNNGESTENGDVICRKPAVVTSIVTRSGTPKVKAGDSVNEGDVLIEGKYDICGDDLEVIEERQVRADGDIVGQVVYDIDMVVNREYIKKEYTGEQISISDFMCNGKEIDTSLWFQKGKYEKYDLFTFYDQMVIGDSFYLPITVERKVYKEYVLSEEIYSEEEIKNIADKKMMYILKKIEENTIQILENNVKIEIGEKNCRIYGQIIVLENIGSFGGTYE